MTTTHKKKQAAAAATQKAAGTRMPRSARGGLTAAAWSGFKAGTPVVTSAALIRVGTGLVDFVLVTVTAFGLIPMLGAYIHQQSGATRGGFSADGTIALWLVPFAFVVVMLTVAEIAFMRWLWRAGSRRIRKFKRARISGHDAAPARSVSPARARAAGKTRAKNTTRGRGR